MLEQMGEAGLALGLVLGADVVPGRHGHDRRLAVGVDDHAQAVVQGEGLERDVDAAGQFGGRDRSGALAQHRRGSRHQGQGENGGEGGAAHDKSPISGATTLRAAEQGSSYGSVTKKPLYMTGL